MENNQEMVANYEINQDELVFKWQPCHLIKPGEDTNLYLLDKKSYKSMFQSMQSESHNISQIRMAHLKYVIDTDAQTNVAK